MFKQEIYEICELLEDGCKGVRRYLDAATPTEYAVGEKVLYEEEPHDILATFNHGANTDRYTIEDQQGKTQKVLEYEIEVYDK